MLAIGRALMNDPKLLMLDEPVEGLAPVIVEEIVAQLKTIPESPVLPGRLFVRAAENALIGHHNQTGHKMQIRVQVNLQRRQNVLMGSKLRLHGFAPTDRDVTSLGTLGKNNRGHGYSRKVEHLAPETGCKQIAASCILYDTRFGTL